MINSKTTGVPAHSAVSESPTGYRVDTPGRDRATEDCFDPHDWSALPSFIRRAAPRVAGPHRYHATAKELNGLAEMAATTSIGLLDTLKVLGKTLNYCDTGELNAGDFQDLADSIMTLSETIKALNELERAACEGLPANEGGRSDA